MGKNQAFCLDCAELSWHTFCKYQGVGRCCNYVALFFNVDLQVLQHSNVETFITFRCSTPIVMALCDCLFLGHELPTLRNWFCLALLLGGALGYLLVDTAFQLEAYIWLLVW